MKIALIGSGASAYGVLQILKRRLKDIEKVTIFDVSSDYLKIQDLPNNRKIKNRKIFNYYNALRQRFGRQFPPPKFDLSCPLTNHQSEGAGKIWKSQFRGGLTNFWGGGCLPFGEKEFEDWGWGRKDIDPYYDLISEDICISGRANGFGNFLGQTFANFEEQRLNSSLKELERNLNETLTSNGSIEASPTPLAINSDAISTLKAYTGEELWYQPDFIWSSVSAFNQILEREAKFELKLGKVLTFNKGTVTYLDSKSGLKTRCTGFNKIYLAAGCLGSTEIAMRSLGIESTELEDNRTVSFPIIKRFSNWAYSVESSIPQFGLSNLTILSSIDKDGIGLSATSVYPFSIHLLRYFSPFFLWFLLEKLMILINQNIYIGRICVGEHLNRKYQILLTEHGVKAIELPSDRTKFTQSVKKRLKHIFKKSGFYVIYPLLNEASNSSHYGSTLPFLNQEKEKINLGEIAPDIHIVDSSIFPKMPSLSPTFTIIANAARITDLSLKKYRLNNDL